MKTKAMGLLLVAVVGGSAAADHGTMVTWYPRMRRAIASDLRPLKVLMIGNSFSESVMYRLPAIAKAEGRRLDIAHMMIGGCSLQQHWENLEKGLADPAFAPYRITANYGGVNGVTNTPVARAVGPDSCGNIPALLRADRWDVVTLQQASGLSWRYETYEPYLGRLVGRIRELAPQAEIRLQQTWAYNLQSDLICDAETGGPGTFGIDQKEMYDALRRAYGWSADAYGLRQIPVGDAVQRYRSSIKNPFKPLTKAELAAVPDGQVPGIGGDAVGCFYWKAPKGETKTKLKCDSIHLNSTGTYLQALVWYGALFNVNPREVKYAPRELDQETARLMRQSAAVSLGR